MLSEKEYRKLVKRDLIGRLFEDEQLTLSLFRSKVESLSLSSEWATRLNEWNDKFKEIGALPSDSSDDDDVSRVKVLKTYKRRRMGEVLQLLLLLNPPQSFIRPWDQRLMGPRLKKLISRRPFAEGPRVFAGPKARTPRPEGPRPIVILPRPRVVSVPSSADERQNFGVYVKNKFDEVHKFLADQTLAIRANQDLIKAQQKMIDEQRKKNEAHEKHIIGLTAALNSQAQQLSILIRRDTATTQRHQQLVVLNKKMRS
ncbi:hypothetical protein Hanom_Chr09g00849731 [Helianthus anomalus]